MVLEWPVVRTMGWLPFSVLFAVVVGAIWAAVAFPGVATVGGVVVAVLYFGGFGFTAWQTARDSRRLKRAQHLKALRPDDRCGE